jgi:hypothetical protein
MRGVPTHPVRCADCDRPNACPSDRLCHGCRIALRPPPNRKFIWTSELDDMLRRAYYKAHTRSDLSANLDVMQRNTGFTRVVLLNRAVQLGLSFCRRRPWTAEEIEILTVNAGRIAPRAISRKLNRTNASVKAKLKELEITARVTEGYSQDDLQHLLGVGAKAVRRWLACGWLQSVNGRISEACIIRFLRQHSDQYQLSRVNEAWYKGLLFPAFNYSVQRQTITPHVRRHEAHRLSA